MDKDKTITGENTITDANVKGAGVPETIVKGAGAVYQICSSIIETYYNKQSLLWLSNLEKDLKAGANDAYKANHNFNQLLFADVADCVIRMLMSHDKFYAIGLENVTPTFQRIWKFHKKWLLTDTSSDEAWDMLSQEVNTLAKDENEFIRGIYVAALKDIQRTHSQSNGRGNSAETTPPM